MGCMGEAGGRLVYKGLREMDEGISRDGTSLSEEAVWRGPCWGAPPMGALEGMLR